MDSILDLGIRLIVALQRVGEWQIPIMRFFTFLGTEDFYMLVLPILYWCISNSLGARVAIILMLSGGTNDALKLIFHAPRPYWYSPEVRAFAQETSFGLPSGHAQNAVAIWGMMAAYLKKRWGWIIAILLMFLIGLSRLSLGVHFPHDILAGWIAGSLLLWLTVRLWRPLAQWAKEQPFRAQVLWAFLASLGLLWLSFVPFQMLYPNWQPPQSWAEYATQAVSVEGMLTTGGTLFGLLFGLAWLQQLGGFKTKGQWWQLVLRYLLGALGVFIIRYTLKAIFPAGDAWPAYAFRYLRYALIGFWMTGGAPWLFLRFKLAESQKPPQTNLQATSPS